MASRLVGEILTAILLIVSLAGAAIKVAKMAAAGIRSVLELAALVTEAEGTEIGVAAKGLLQAEQEVQAARLSGDAQRIAEAEKKAAAAAQELKGAG